MQHVSKGAVQVRCNLGRRTRSSIVSSPACCISMSLYCARFSGLSVIEHWPGGWIFPHRPHNSPCWRPEAFVRLCMGDSARDVRSECLWRDAPLCLESCLEASGTGGLEPHRCSIMLSSISTSIRTALASDSGAASETAAWKSESSDPADLSLDFFRFRDLFCSFVGVSPRSKLC